ncbi:aspartate aminotransferase family protein [Actinophytocola sp.]|uniref:aspartate aminotransferase family protein n=1 Tax=Actinophytocola sp. TaxID=1872138 RepID=UPI003D6BE1A6
MTEPAWDFPASRALYERARAVIPGGSTRQSVFYRPHPLYAVAGEGCRVRFVDGHEALDFHNNFTSLVLGHGHPAVLSAAHARLDSGVALGAPTEPEIELAELLAGRFAGVEQVVFCTTGSEAIMLGIRLARAVTGRAGVAKFEGGYHGGYDHAKVSGMVGPDGWGDELEPESVPDTGGLPPRVAAEVHVARFNSLPSLRRVLDRHGDRIGVLVLEPVLGAGGMIPPEPGFLAEVRRLTRRLGIVLLCDEVITQRLAVGGGQEKYGVVADLTVVSKVSGNGFPISALGGSRALMAPLDGSGRDGPAVYHSGTYNANPLSVAVSLATLRTLDAELIGHLDRLGELARGGLRERFAARGVPAVVTGTGSLFNVHFTTRPPTDYRGVRGADRQRLAEFHRQLLRGGVLLAGRGMGCISAPMVAADVATLLRATDKALSELGW